MNERIQSQAKAAESSSESSSFTSPRSGLLQRKCACGGTPGVDGLCAECRSKRLILQRSRFVPAEQSEAPPIVHEVLRAPGRPLDAEPRSFMEPRFGHDFSQVRIHDESRAAASARAVGALAYTVGHNVVFGAGQYAPSTGEGRRILAHELAHVVQQGDRVTSTSTELPVGDVATPYEHEAETVADRLVNVSEPTHPTPLILQKAPKPAIMRVPITRLPFTSKMEICRRVLTSREFRISQGGLVVTANARWEASPEWQGPERPECGVEVYDMELNRVGGYFGVIDSGYGGCEFATGVPISELTFPELTSSESLPATVELSNEEPPFELGDEAERDWPPPPPKSESQLITSVPVSRTWTNLPEGDYYLTISTGNTNPNCCLVGEIEVSEKSGLSGESCTQLPPGPWEIVHGALAIAGLIPFLGVVPDAIDAGIYVIEGDWVSAGLSAVAIIPILGDAASVVRSGGRMVVRVEGEAVERIGRDRIATALREARASKRAATEAAERRLATEAADDLPTGASRRHAELETPNIRARVPGLVGCRAGSLFCPIDFLRQEFAELFEARSTSEFARYIRELPEIDLSMGRSLRREQTILTGDAMYAQYLREVSPSQWSEPFREALSQARRPGLDYREIVVEGQRRHWPLDNLGDPWVVHHDPPLGWVSAESNQWWHPVPYRIHDAAHKWWSQVERRVKSKIPPEWQSEILEGAIDIREFTP
jgi:hypothetical protein